MEGWITSKMGLHCGHDATFESRELQSWAPSSIDGTAGIPGHTGAKAA
jgi:hypothetical protein